LFVARQYGEIITLLQYLMIFVSVTGGFVASDMVIKLVELIKGTVKVEDSNAKPTSDSN